LWEKVARAKRETDEGSISQHSSFFQRERDRVQHAVSVRNQIAVPESQDAKSAPLQFRVTAAVVSSIVSVLAPVELDDQLGIEAHEVGNERPYRHLPPKLETRKPPATKIGPELPFMRRRRRPEVA
jgi:hypothetical protein